MTHDPWPLTHYIISSYRTQERRGMVVLDNTLGLESKKS